VFSFCFSRRFTGAGLISFGSPSGLFLFSPPSYGFAFCLAGLAASFAARGRWIWFHAAALALLAAKASFFITIAGGLFLWFLRRGAWKQGALHMALLGAFFVGMFKLFLSGAHAHNHWILFPMPLFFPFFQADYAITARTFFNLAVTSGLFVAFAWPALAAWRRAENGILLPASLALSGLLGIFVLTEATESNSAQFFLAACLFASAVLWSEWKRSRPAPPGAARRALGAAGILLLSLSLYASAKALCAARPNAYPSDLTAAYSWLSRETPADTVVLFGKHYENRPYQSSWGPGTSFVRSALSDRQMWCENFKHKGVGMEAGFPRRFAEGRFFYETLVESSPESRRALKTFPNPAFSASPQPPLNEDPAFFKRLLSKLGGGKKTSWINRFKQTHYETRQALEALKTGSARPEEWAQEFLAREKIGYVVLEMADAPGPWLASHSTEVYKNRSVRIFQIQPAA
jgi:hypothetical protein